MRPLILRYTALFILVTGTFPLAGQDLSSGPDLPPKQFLTRLFTVEEGLPVNAVTGIAKDRQGYIYFSTMNGIARYDGYRFVTFNVSNSPGLISNRITGIMADQWGSLWLLNEQLKLVRYDGPAYGFTPIGAEEGLPGAVSRIREGIRTVWVSTDRGVFRYDREARRFHALPEPRFAADTWALEPTASGGVLAVNRHGLLHWENGKADLLLAPGDSPLPMENISGIAVRDDYSFWLMGLGGFFLVVDGVVSGSSSYLPGTGEGNFNVMESMAGPAGSRLFSTTAGFMEADPAAGTVTALPVQVNTGNASGSLHTGPDGERILLGDDEVLVNDEIVFRADQIQEGYVDNDGSIWVASWTDGVYQIRRNRVLNLTSAGGRPLENIYPIIETKDGAVWAGSFRYGIFRLREGETDNWHTGNSNLSADVVRYLHQDTDGTVYAGIWAHGLWQYTGDTWVRVAELDRVMGSSDLTVESMYRDRRGRLLVGSLSAMAVKEGDTWQRLRTDRDESVNGVRVIREDSRGTLYLGSNGNGIYRMKGDLLRRFADLENGLASSYIRDIYLQSDDTLWVATQDRGLNRLVLDDAGRVDSVVHVGAADGLVNDALHRIIEGPHGNLWISSNAGIMRIPLSDLNRYADSGTGPLRLLHFDEQSGMINREANGGVQTAGMLRSDSTVWFPNQAGITVLETGQQDMPPVAPVLLEEVSLSDSTLLVGGRDRLRLPLGERNIQFAFTAPNFALPGQMTFWHRFTGADEAWTAGGRTASYTNLPPGNHTFEVAAERPDGTRTTAALIVSVPPYIYETTLFYAAMALLAGLMAYGGHRYRVGTLKRQEQRLQHRVEQQTAELRRAAEEKSRFFSRITHDLKTPLSLIVGPLDDMLLEHSGDRPAVETNRLRVMSRNSRRLQQMVNQILDVSRLNANALQLTLQPADLRRLTLSICGQFRSLLQQQEISLEMETGPPVSVYVDLDAWERIVFNLMSNAIRHSPRGGRIFLDIREEDGHAALILRDQGEGIPEAEQEKVFNYLYQAEGEYSRGGTGIGLYLVRGLAEHMGGSVALRSREGEGAEFTVRLRLGDAHFSAADRVTHVPWIPAPDEAFAPMQGAGHEQARGESLQEHGGGPSARILVVEDDTDFRDYLASILSGSYQIRLAAEGHEALQLLEEWRPDLVISDVMMPGMGGVEFVDRLRDMHDLRTLPVLFLSAKNHEADIREGLSSGADVYLTKPIQSRMLLSQVRAILRRERVLRKQEAGYGVSEEPDLVARVRQIVYRHLADSNLSVELLADALYMSRSKLYREWSETGEKTLNDYIVERRMEEARVLIAERGFNVQQAACAVGYADPSYFSRSFKKVTGQSPSELK
ncbi:MAG: response regulator [Balneolaceae bacterium]|nr:response regulator [Balneolaceae bacterium]